MSAIHLIEKLGTSQGLKPVDVKSGLWTSGYWKVTEETAKKLVGGKIYLHTGWTARSHFGGNINSYSIHSAPGTKEDGRIVFHFTSLQECKEVLAPPGAMGEKRIVW